MYAFVSETFLFATTQLLLVTHAFATLLIYVMSNHASTFAFSFSFSFPFQAAKALEEKLKSSGVPFEVHIYKGLGHAFMNASPEGLKRRKEMGMNDEDPAAIELAWSRFASWMRKYLSSA